MAAKKWYPKYFYDAKDRRYAFCPDCGQPLPWGPDVERICSGKTQLKPIFDCGFCKARMVFDLENRIWHYSPYNELKQGEPTMVVDKQQMNQMHGKLDPYGVKTDPADANRKGMILEVLQAIIGTRRDGQIFNRALDIGCSEGWMTVDLPAEEIVGYDISDVAISRAYTEHVPDAHEVPPDKLRFTCNPNEGIEGKFDLIIAAGVLVDTYDHAGIFALINKHASGIVITCQTDKTEIPGVEEAIAANQVEVFEFPYREHKQRLRVFDFGKPGAPAEVTHEEVVAELEAEGGTASDAAMPLTEEAPIETEEPVDVNVVDVPPLPESLTNPINEDSTIKVETPDSTFSGKVEDISTEEIDVPDMNDTGPPNDSGYSSENMEK